MACIVIQVTLDDVTVRRTGEVAASVYTNSCMKTKYVGQNMHR